MSNNFTIGELIHANISYLKFSTKLIPANNDFQDLQKQYQSDCFPITHKNQIKVLVNVQYEKGHRPNIHNLCACLLGHLTIRNDTQS